jgi:hypothetical protein
MSEGIHKCGARMVYFKLVGSECPQADLMFSLANSLILDD